MHMAFFLLSYSLPDSRSGRRWLYARRMSLQGSSLEEPIVISSESDAEDVILRALPNSPIKLVHSSI